MARTGRAFATGRMVIPARALPALFESSQGTHRLESADQLDHLPLVAPCVLFFASQQGHRFALEDGLHEPRL